MIVIASNELAQSVISAFASALHCKLLEENFGIDKSVVFFLTEDSKPAFGVDIAKNSLLLPFEYEATVEAMVLMVAANQRAFISEMMDYASSVVMERLPYISMQG